MKVCRRAHRLIGPRDLTFERGALARLERNDSGAAAGSATAESSRADRETVISGIRKPVRVLQTSKMCYIFLSEL